MKARIPGVKFVFLMDLGDLSLLSVHQEAFSLLLTSFRSPLELLSLVLF